MDNSRFYAPLSSISFKSGRLFFISGQLFTSACSSESSWHQHSVDPFECILGKLDLIARTVERPEFYLLALTLKSVDVSFLPSFFT